MGRYTGKICDKHPELQGARFESSKKCVGCSYARNNALRKKPEQLARIRSYLRDREKKGGVEYENKKARNRKWYENNKDWRRACNLRRKGLGGKFEEYRTEIKKIYENKPAGCHVDHIVPLKGLCPITKVHIVCGLHVPWNLQYLNGEDNMRKWAWFIQT